MTDYLNVKKSPIEGRACTQNKCAVDFDGDGEVDAVRTYGEVVATNPEYRDVGWKRREAQEKLGRVSQRVPSKEVVARNQRFYDGSIKMAKKHVENLNDFLRGFLKNGRAEELNTPFADNEVNVYGDKQINSVGFNDLTDKLFEVRLVNREEKSGYIAKLRYDKLGLEYVDIVSINGERQESVHLLRQDLTSETLELANAIMEAAKKQKSS